MKILPVNIYKPAAPQQNLKRNDNTSGYFSKSDYNPLYYNDYNVSFSGRTPENFYAQDFNRENMPITMNDYLMSNYEFNQHMPPEQMMQESFKYLGISKNFDDVKSIYPNEDLFKNLHECSISDRKKGLLSEIKVARELGESPLLKDGSDNFGMYLLKKIYLEGKTLKEISKDFLEKDISDEYKGVVTEPVKYSTLASYGISYPKLSFWHSFINTRDEYKKFFIELPKNSPNTSANSASASKTSATDTQAAEDSKKSEKRPKRKYNIKPYHKKQLMDDISNNKTNDSDDVKKTVIKRLGKDNPEASFIIKYMSPIMIVATERVHLSEELKSFAEAEKCAGIVSDRQTMLKRFWKNNAYMLKAFSASIVDTIDMFEDLYGAGGNIPINADFNKADTNSDNPKILDFVNEEFYDLLAYTKTVKPTRDKMYLEHDKLQKEWENHFNERYSQTTVVPLEDNNGSVDGEMSEYEKMQMLARQKNAVLYLFVASDGKPVYVVANLDKGWEDELKTIGMFMPTRFSSLFVREMKKMPVSDKLKLTIAANASGKKIEDERIFTPEEFTTEYYKLLEHFNMVNRKYEHAARIALADVIVPKLSMHTNGKIFYSIPAFEYSYIFADKNNPEYARVILDNKKEFDAYYESLIKPLSQSEIKKIELKLFNILSKYDPDKSIYQSIDMDTKYLVLMLKDMAQFKNKRSSFTRYLDFMLKDSPAARSILNESDPDCAQAKAEVILFDLLSSFLVYADSNPYMLAVFNNETYQKYRPSFSNHMTNIIDDIINKMNPDEKMMFNCSNDYLKIINKKA